MMEREDIRKTLVNQDYNFTPKNSVELVTWQFTCDFSLLSKDGLAHLVTSKSTMKTNRRICKNISKQFKMFLTMLHHNSLKVVLAVLAATGVV